MIDGGKCKTSADTTPRCTACKVLYSSGQSVVVGTPKRGIDGDFCSRVVNDEAYGPAC